MGRDSTARTWWGAAGSPPLFVWSNSCVPGVSLRTSVLSDLRVLPPRIVESTAPDAHVRGGRTCMSAPH